MRVLIWGTGDYANRYLHMGEIGCESLLGFIETKRSKKAFMGKNIYEPHEISAIDFDYVLVCVVGKSNAIYDVAMASGINPKKMIFIDNYVRTEYDILHLPTRIFDKVSSYQDSEKILKMFPVLYENIIRRFDRLAETYAVGLRNAFDTVDTDNVLAKSEFDSLGYQKDYTRFRCFDFVAREIKKKKVEGSIAELGVFRGHFARMLNFVFPDRTLYLFDTFDSFDESEFQQELEKGNCVKAFLNDFKDTSEDYVLNIMPHPSNVIIRKGVFPETSAGLENERYVFVSLDVDFEESTLHGLRYFYPKLARGGTSFCTTTTTIFLAA